MAFYRYRKAVPVLLAAALLGCSLTACTSKVTEEQHQYKKEAIAAMDKGDYQTALELFDKAINLREGKTTVEELDLGYYKSLAQFKNGDSQGAIDTLTAFLAEDPENWELYFLRGNIYISSERGEEALADYAKAAELNSSISMFTAMSENLTAHGLVNEADEYLQKALALEPETADDFERIGYCYFLNGDYDNASDNLEKARREGNDEALLDLGRLYMAKEQPDTARSYFEDYMEKFPYDADALNELGKVAYSVEDYAAAVEYFLKAYDNAPKDDNAEIRVNLIATYERQADYDSALIVAESYLKDYPDDTVVQREREFLKTRTAKFKEDMFAKQEQETAEREAAEKARIEAEKKAAEAAENGETVEDTSSGNLQLEGAVTQ